eukprot:751443-Hanusia_phi.AAC.1
MPLIASCRDDAIENTVQLLRRSLFDMLSLPLVICFLPDLFSPLSSLSPPASSDWGCRCGVASAYVTPVSITSKENLSRIVRDKVLSPLV